MAKAKQGREKYTQIQPTIHNAAEHKSRFTVMRCEFFSKVYFRDKYYVLPFLLIIPTLHTWHISGQYWHPTSIIRFAPTIPIINHLLSVYNH